jgi:hypothetical protein
MTFCPSCRNTNVYDTVQRGIQACNDCGAEFRNDITFKEGSYNTFMENVLNTIAEGLQPLAASAVINIRDHVLDDKNDIQSIVESLMDLTENVNSGNELGYDRKSDVIGIIEGIEKIVSYAKILCHREEITERTAYRLAILEGSEPSSWSRQPLQVPDLSYDPETVDQPGEISDFTQPSASEIVTDEEPVWENVSWMGEDVQVRYEENNGIGKYNVRSTNGPMITYNEESGAHDGIENFSEEQLAELDASLSTPKNIDDIQGPITSTGNEENPAVQAEELSQPMIADESVMSDLDIVAQETADFFKNSGNFNPSSDEMSEYIQSRYPEDAGSMDQIISQVTEYIQGTQDQDGNGMSNVESYAVTLASAGGNDMDESQVNGPIGSPVVPPAQEVGGGLDSAKNAPIYAQVTKNLKNKINRGCYSTNEARKAFTRVARASSGLNEGSDDIAGKLLAEFESTHVNGQSNSPIVGESSLDGEMGIDITPIDGVVSPDSGDEADVLTQSIEDNEHEEAESDAIEVIGTKAEKAQSKVEAAEEAIEALKDAVEELKDIEDKENCEGDECDIEDTEEDVEEGAEDDFGDVEDDISDNISEKIEELTKRKFGTGKYDGVGRPEVIPTTCEATGKAPTRHVVKYVGTVRGEDGSCYEEEQKIPFTQAEADESEVDENGKKTPIAGDKNNSDSYTNEDFEKRRPLTKGKPIKEMERFNGFRLGDKIKVIGHPTSFTLAKISGTPVKFTLTEGIVTITVDAINDEFELDGDANLKWQRTSSILEDTRSVWEAMEKDMVNEGCAGGVCSIGGPMTALNSTSGIGNVASAGSMFIRTPIRTISKEIAPNDIYAYIKNNNLHNSPRGAAISHVMSNFMNPNVDIDKIYDDAVLSLNASNDYESLNEVDSSYKYVTTSTRSIDVEQTINDGYDALKKLGIV